MKAFLTLFTLGITASGTAQTQRFEDINGLEAMVVAKFGAAIGQPGGPAAPIDRRLKLAACPDTPSVEGPVMGAAVIRCAPVGWRIRVPLRAGEMAAASDKAAILIKKGDPVQLIAGNASFTVSTTMIADEDGAQGDMIRVRADRRSAPVVARVVENGIVRAPGFN
ncbi:MAG TPA: flagella basal body P-ring formation protein FlgA [Rhizorhapis sp.]